MTDTPERIWAGWRGAEMSTSAEDRPFAYVSADLVPRWSDDMDASNARIAALEAENGRLRAERHPRVEELEEHIANMLQMQECACGHDDPMDVCLGHATILKRIEALEAERDSLVYALSGLVPSVEGLLTACEKAGVFDSLISELFPDAKCRGVRRDQGFSAIDAARNDVRMWAGVARAALKGEGE